MDRGDIPAVRTRKENRKFRLIRKQWFLSYPGPSGNFSHKIAVCNDELHENANRNLNSVGKSTSSPAVQPVTPTEPSTQETGGRSGAKGAKQATAAKKAFSTNTVNPWGTPWTAKERPGPDDRFELSKIPQSELIDTFPPTTTHEIPNVAPWKRMRPLPDQNNAEKMSSPAGEPSAGSSPKSKLRKDARPETDVSVSPQSSSSEGEAGGSSSRDVSKQNREKKKEKVKPKKRAKATKEACPVHGQYQTIPQKYPKIPPIGRCQSPEQHCPVLANILALSGCPYSISPFLPYPSSTVYTPVPAPSFYGCNAVASEWVGTCPYSQTFSTVYNTCRAAVDSQAGTHPANQTHSRGHVCNTDTTSGRTLTTGNDNSVVPCYQRPPAWSQFHTGTDCRGLIPGLNTVHREVMDLHHEQLLAAMDPRQMTCALLGLGAIGDDHCLQLDLTYPDGAKAVNRLLLAYLRKQGTAGFLALVNALKRCYLDGMAASLMHAERHVVDLFFYRPAPQQPSTKTTAERARKHDKKKVLQKTEAEKQISDLERRVDVLVRLASLAKQGLFDQPCSGQPNTPFPPTSDTSEGFGGYSPDAQFPTSTRGEFSPVAGSPAANSTVRDSPENKSNEPGQPGRKQPEFPISSSEKGQPGESPHKMARKPPFESNNNNFGFSGRSLQKGNGPCGDIQPQPAGAGNWSSNAFISSLEESSEPSPPSVATASVDILSAAVNVESETRGPSERPTRDETVLAVIIQDDDQQRVSAPSASSDAKLERFAPETLQADSSWTSDIPDIPTSKMFLSGTTFNSASSCDQIAPPLSLEQSAHKSVQNTVLPSSGTTLSQCCTTKTTIVSTSVRESCCLVERAPGTSDRYEDTALVNHLRSASSQGPFFPSDCRPARPFGVEKTVCLSGSPEEGGKTSPQTSQSTTTFGFVVVASRPASQENSPDRSGLVCPQISGQIERHLIMLEAEKNLRTLSQPKARLNSASPSAEKRSLVSSSLEESKSKTRVQVNSASPLTEKTSSALHSSTEKDKPKEGLAVRESETGEVGRTSSRHRTSHKVVPPDVSHIFVTELPPTQTTLGRTMPSTPLSVGQCGPRWVYSHSGTATSKNLVDKSGNTLTLSDSLEANTASGSYGIDQRHRALDRYAMASSVPALPHSTVCRFHRRDVSHRNATGRCCPLPSVARTRLSGESRPSLENYVHTTGQEMAGGLGDGFVRGAVYGRTGVLDGSVKHSETEDMVRVKVSYTKPRIGKHRRRQKLTRDPKRETPLESHEEYLLRPFENEIPDLETSTSVSAFSERYGRSMGGNIRGKHFETSVTSAEHLERNPKNTRDCTVGAHKAHCLDANSTEAVECVERDADKTEFSGRTRISKKNHNNTRIKAHSGNAVHSDSNVETISKHGYVVTGQLRLASPRKPFADCEIEMLHCGGNMTNNSGNTERTRYTTALNDGQHNITYNNRRPRRQRGSTAHRNLNSLNRKGGEFSGGDNAPNNSRDDARNNNKASSNSSVSSSSSDSDSDPREHKSRINALEKTVTVLEKFATGMVTSARFQRNQFLEDRITALERTLKSAQDINRLHNVENKVRLLENTILQQAKDAEKRNAESAKVQALENKLSALEAASQQQQATKQLEDRIVSLEKSLFESNQQQQSMKDIGDRIGSLETTVQSVFQQSYTQSLANRIGFLEGRLQTHADNGSNGAERDLKLLSIELRLSQLEQGRNQFSAGQGQQGTNQFSDGQGQQRTNQFSAGQVQSPGQTAPAFQGQNPGQTAQYPPQSPAENKRKSIIKK